MDANAHPNPRFFCLGSHSLNEFVLGEWLGQRRYFIRPCDEVGCLGEEDHLRPSSRSIRYDPRDSLQVFTEHRLCTKLACRSCRTNRWEYPFLETYLPRQEPLVVMPRASRAGTAFTQAIGSLISSNLLHTLWLSNTSNLCTTRLRTWTATLSEHGRSSTSSATSWPTTRK